MDNAPNRTNSTARHWTSALLGMSGVALVAGCGSYGGTSSGTPSAPATSASATGAPASASASASALPCAQISALRSTLTDITHASLSSAGRLGTDLAKARQELDTLKSQQGPYAAQANRLANEINAIKTSAAATVKTPTPTNLTKLTSSINSFKSTAEPLIHEMQTACP
jgi:hypothetical protein